MNSLCHFSDDVYLFRRDLLQPNSKDLDFAASLISLTTIVRGMKNGIEILRVSTKIDFPKVNLLTLRPQWCEQCNNSIGLSLSISIYTLGI